MNHRIKGKYMRKTLKSKKEEKKKQVKYQMTALKINTYLTE